MTTTNAQNHKDIVTLRDLMYAELKAIKATMEATDKTIDHRLQAMNELREQINRERGQYIGRVEHSATHEQLASDIRELRESRAELAGKASMSAFYLTGTVAVISMIISIASLIHAILQQ